MITKQEVKERLKTDPIDYSGLSDIDKLIVYLRSWNQNDICPYRKMVEREFGWKKSYVQKLRKESLVIEVISLISEYKGGYYGRGYWVDFSLLPEKK